MATTSKLAGKFISATKQFPKNMAGAPWNLIRSTQIPYDDLLYGHSFRTGTMPTTVKLYSVILRAIEMYLRTGSMPYPDAPDYLMVSRKTSLKDANGRTVRGKEYFLEMVWPDGSATVMSKRGNDIRISDMEPDGTNNPICEFKSLDEYRMAGIYLLCLPEILEEDASAAGKLKGKLDDLVLFIPEYASWSSEKDIPEMAKEAAFFMDAVFCYANDHATWQFTDPANTTASVAEQVPGSVTTTGFTGAVVVQSNANVAFLYAKSNGTADSVIAKTMTIAEAKQQFAQYSAHRRWTQAELNMIPQFAPDMPVMDETIRMAKRILGTREAVSPVCNLMWRGVTSYGKSTGIKQLACILNMPLLILTCHPGMEVTEFKSTFVPESEEDGLEVDPLSITLANEPEQMDPNLELAVQHVSQMGKEEREAFLSGSHFYLHAIMDTEDAAYSLFGKELPFSTEELCKLYTETIVYFKEKPLKVKISQMETDEKPEAPQKKSEPGFKHVMSPYLKALINGYLVEVQEPSRIRDSGVLVGINEYDHAGALLHLMNGATARRHKDAICVMTDNVGYSSCRPIDPSVLRRQGMIIDSFELTENMVKDRARRNTGCTDTALLDRCYRLWKTVKDYCETNSITEGSVSPMELERFVQAMLLDGEDSLDVNLADCVISKATSSIEDQRDIKTACGLV